MMKLVIKFLYILCFVLYVTPVHAGVNRINHVSLSNGNFYINYTDITIGIGGRYVPIAVRTYNSKSTYNGMFGFGWGSDLETQLIIGPSGIPVVYNNGGGSRNFFYSNGNAEYHKKISKKSHETMIKILVNEELARKGKKNDENRRKIEEKINKKLKSQEVRDFFWRRLLRQGKITPITIPVGSEYSYICNCSYKKSRIKRTINGYLLTKGGETLEFDIGGLLVKITDTHGNIIHIERDKTGNKQKLIRRVRINDKIIYYFYNSFNKVDRIYYPQEEKIAYYRYDGNDLIYSFDASTNYYRYAYDNQHNLVTVSYGDHSSLYIKYDENYFVSEIVNRAGQKTQYEYNDLEGDPSLNYSTKVTRFPYTGENALKTSEVYEYHSRRTETGSIMRTKEVTVADGIRREFIFNEKGVLTDFVESSTKTSNISNIGFSFDNMGRIKNIESEGWIRDIIYDNEHSSRIEKYDTRYGAEQSIYIFEYDNQDRLIVAKHNDKKVEISYQDDYEKNIASLRTKYHFLRVVRDDGGRVVSLNLESDDSSEMLELIYPNKYSDDKMKINNSNPSLAYRISGILSGMMSICAPAQAEVSLEVP